MNLSHFEAAFLFSVFTSVVMGVVTKRSDRDRLHYGVYTFGCFLLALFETATAKMRVFRIPQFLGAALMLGLLGTLLLFVSRSF
jgi:formate hydrogenlyase subunit 4